MVGITGPEAIWNFRIGLQQTSLPGSAICPFYAVDLLVRSAPALQQTPSADVFGAYLSSAEAAAQGLAEGDAVQVRQNGSVVRAQVWLDDAVPAGCVRIPAGVIGSESLGDQIGPVSLTKA